MRILACGMGIGHGPLTMDADHRSAVWSGCTSRRPAAPATGHGGGCWRPACQLSGNMKEEGEEEVETESAEKSFSAQADRSA